MFLLRVLLPFAVLLLAWFGIAYFVTRDRKYLRYLVIAIQVELLVVVTVGLAYVFERLFFS